MMLLVAGSIPTLLAGCADGVCARRFDWGDRVAEASGDRSRRDGATASGGVILPSLSQSVTSPPPSISNTSPSNPTWTRLGWNAVFSEGYREGWNRRHRRAATRAIRRAPSPSQLGVSSAMWNQVFNYGYKQAWRAVVRFLEG
jgi:hypothetical protein